MAKQGYVMVIYIATVLMFVTMQTIIMANGHATNRFNKENGQQNFSMFKDILRNWSFVKSMPLSTIREPIQGRLKRSVHREKIPNFIMMRTAPYSSLVRIINVGCIGALISKIHVLTSAHCVHDGVKKRTFSRSNPLRVEVLLPNGKQRRRRVRKIFVPSEIKSELASRQRHDYAVLKLHRPHKLPYLSVKAAKQKVHVLNFHVFQKKRIMQLYKYSNCYARKHYMFYLTSSKYCPNSVGNSGTPAFDSTGSNGNSIIGLMTGNANYRNAPVGVVLRMTDAIVNKINGWVAESS